MCHEATLNARTDPMGVREGWNEEELKNEEEPQRGAGLK
jgi:hypothetical protein